MQEQFDLVFWQNAPSIHQAPLMRALTSNLSKRVLVVVPEAVSHRRRAMGWGEIDYGGAKILVERSPDARLEIVEATRNAAAHIFSGLGAHPEITQLMMALARGHHNHIAVITEPWDPRGNLGRLRALRFRLQRLRLPKVDTLFACGRLAAQQFVSIGTERSTVAPFGYFVDGAVGALSPRRDDDHNFIFVGTFTDRKDPETLLRALALTSLTGWKLTMIGDGPLRARSIDLAKDLNLDQRVTFVRSMTNDAVLNSIASSDALILPSKYDGWGAVVSEALMAGTPVILTRECGASDLVRSGLQGSIFEASQPAQLAEALSKLLRAGPATIEDRIHLRDWAEATISPRVAAQYLWENVTRSQKSPTSPAPWRASP